MTESMIEKLAMAMHAADGVKTAAAFEDEPESNQWDYRQMARAVLLALREPTEGMVDAMYANGAEGDPSQVASDFTAAIDHILNESGQPANPT